MQPIVNEFSWSVSRARLFEECPRKYYYNYYGSWGGWAEAAPERARLCYRLKQIKDLPMWAGDVVHRTLETSIRHIASGRGADLEDMQTTARDILNREWKESAERLWLRHAKKYTSLFEHYYDVDISAEQRAAIRARVFDCLAAFVQMGYPRLLRSYLPEEWLSVEELAEFEATGVKMWVKIDCAVRKGREVFIYDWKTGKAGEDDTPTDQLICYALYAAARWNAPVESINLCPVYLAEAKAPTHKIAAEQIIEFRERVFRSVEGMMALLEDRPRNRAREESFPRTDDRRKCARCGFFEACWGDRSLSPPM